MQEVFASCRTWSDWTTSSWAAAWWSWWSKLPLLRSVDSSARNHAIQPCREGSLPEQPPQSYHGASLRQATGMSQVWLTANLVSCASTATRWITYAHTTANTTSSVWVWLSTAYPQRHKRSRDKQLPAPAARHDTVVVLLLPFTATSQLRLNFWLLLFWCLCSPLTPSHEESICSSLWRWSCHT